MNIAFETAKPFWSARSVDLAADSYGGSHRAATRANESRAVGALLPSPKSVCQGGYRPASLFETVVSGRSARAPEGLNGECHRDPKSCSYDETPRLNH